MPRRKPTVGELIQWLQTLDPHLSLIGEYDSNYFFAGDPPWKQVMFVAQGDNVVSIREPDHDWLDHDWLDEDEHGYWRTQVWQPGILISWR